MEGSQADLQQSVNAMVLQMLQNQVRKTCTPKCLPDGKYVDVLGKNEKICFAKCMDRMFEAYSVVTKASTEMAQNLQSQLDQENSE